MLLGTRLIFWMPYFSPQKKHDLGNPKDQGKLVQFIDTFL